MDPQTALILSFTTYKLLSLLVGVFFAYLGYRLFVAGIFGHAGDLNAEFKETKILLRRAAPGTFFSVLGAIIVVATIIASYNFQYSPQGGFSSNPTQPELP